MRFQGWAAAAAAGGRCLAAGVLPAVPAMSTPTLLCSSQSRAAAGLKHEEEQHSSDVCCPGTYLKSEPCQLNKKS